MAARALAAADEPEAAMRANAAAKGKSAIHIQCEMPRTKGTLFGEFWARGYLVSTVGPNEEQIRQYIRDQEKLQKDFDQGDELFQ